jgi:hypothetical protein
MEQVIFWAAFLFIIKHLIVDFILQGPYQYLNKGKYGHPGGIQHAVYHSLGTLTVLFLVTLGTSDISPNFLLALGILFLSIFDGVAHYHMDYFKVNWCQKNGYKPHTDLGCNVEQAHKYWYWVGIDQTVHLLTYLIIVWIFTLG